MKNTINIKVNNKEEFNDFVNMLIDRDFIQLSGNLFEDEKSYVRISIAK